MSVTIVDNKHSKVNAFLNTAIILPAKDEQYTIQALISSLKQALGYTIIVIDDGSSDKTAEISKAAGAVVFKHVTNLGAWRATQTGIRYALKQGFDQVITCDADGQHTLEGILTLLEGWDLETDCLIGSCTSRGSVGRHMTWKFFKRVSGLKVFDLTSGLRLYSKRAMRVLSSRPATMFEYQDVGVLLMLDKLKMSIREIPVEMNERKNGISRIFHSWVAVFRYLLYTFVLSVSKFGPYRVEKYHNKLISKVNSE